MSAASEGQRLGTVALGVANLVGVVVLGSLLADPQVRPALSLAGGSGVGTHSGGYSQCQ